MREGLKKAVERAIRENIILSQNEAEQAINFVFDLLEAEQDDIEEHESYATNTISSLQDAKNRVSELATTIFDYYEELED